MADLTAAQRNYLYSENNYNHLKPFEKGCIPWNKGLSRNEETKQKIRKSHLGLKHSKETKKKISEAGKGNKNCLGHKLSEEHKRKISENNHWKNKGFMIGKHHSKETKRKMSEKREGSKNANWNGGISKLPYSFNFNEELKKSIRKRDNYTCQFLNCNEKQNGKKHLVHHIDYDKLNSNPNNLITLCKVHNSKVNYNREYWTKYFRGRILWQTSQPAK